MNNLVTIEGIKGYIDENGTVYLHIEDVARGLGFTQVSSNGNEVVRWKRVNNYLGEFGYIPTSGDGNKIQAGRCSNTFIPENIFYRLAMKAKNETAEKFQTKVANEILPAIRKHGGYLTPTKIDEILSDPDTIIKLATDLKMERQKRLEVEKTNAILMHVNKTYTATEIAKELGFKSAIALNNDLISKKVQFKQNGTWVLYSQYADKGYAEIKQSVLDNGKIVYDRRWTQLGREFLMKLYKMGC